LTLGRFGRQESQRWYYTGPVGVALHLASNAINASIIKGTPGFGGTSITKLTFFWCTRPRISWLIVALAPYQAEKSMYLSAIASILFSEVILQVFAGYYMIVGANYARKQKFFLAGHLVGSRTRLFFSFSPKSVSKPGRFNSGVNHPRLTQLR
jgi:hypothetical protein